MIDIPNKEEVLIRELHALGLDISLYSIEETPYNQQNETEVDLVLNFEKNLNCCTFYLRSKDLLNYQFINLLTI